MKPSNDIWPPPPARPEPKPDHVPVYAGRYLTGINWLDAVLGVPAGFLIGFVLYAAAGLLVQAIKGVPFHDTEMEAINTLGAVLTSVIFVLVNRTYSLFGFTMFIGGVPFYLFMFALEWLIPAN